MKVKDKLEIFCKAALLEADEKRERLLAEIQEQFDGVCDEIRRKAQIEADEKVDAELYKAAQHKNREILNASIEAKKSLLNLRNQLIDDLFEDVTSKITEFVETDDYITALAEDIKELSSQVEGQLELNICKRDMALKDILEKVAPVIVSESSDDIMGGFRATIPGKNVLFDYSYGERLREARNSFSSFKIN